jgi:hypothetical protein
VLSLQDVENPEVVARSLRIGRVDVVGFEAVIAVRGRSGRAVKVRLVSEITAHPKDATRGFL